MCLGLNRGAQYRVEGIAVLISIIVRYCHARESMLYPVALDSPLDPYRVGLFSRAFRGLPQLVAIFISLPLYGVRKMLAAFPDPPHPRSNNGRQEIKQEAGT